MRILSRLLAAAVAKSMLLLLPVLPALHASRPNIVLVVADDIGTGWIPPYADRLQLSDLEPEILAAYAQKRGRLGKVDPEKHIQAARTAMPFLDKLAKEGLVFDNAFATAALCSPSRAALLTGTFQQQWGAYTIQDIEEHGIPADRVVIAEPLKAAGYATAIIGKWHVSRKDPAILEKVWTEQLGESLPIPPGYKGRWPELSKLLDGSGYKSSTLPEQHPLQRGFDYYYGFNSHDSKYYEARELWENYARVAPRPPGEFLTELLSGKAAQFIASAVEQKKPFFLYYAPLTLHGPIVPPPQKYTEKFDTGHRFTDEYAGHLLALDEGIRQIFAALEAEGELDNTLFIFTTDNGGTLYHVPPHNAPNRGGKGTGWLGGLNVPLVIWGKAVKTGGITKEIISLADLLPTILDYAGVGIPGGISGKSYLPYLTGQEAKGPREWLSSIGLQSSRWSYFYEGQGENNDRDAGQAPLYAWYFDGQYLLMRVTPTRAGLYASLPDGLPARTLLFDISRDRQQRSNLAAPNWERVAAMDNALRQSLSGLRPPEVRQRQDFQLLLRKVEFSEP